MRSLWNRWNLPMATISAAFGAGFLIYSTYVTNNLQIVGEQWINETYRELYGIEPSEHNVSMLWACVIAAKEVGKIFGTLLIHLMAEKLGRKGGMLLNILVVVLGCFICFISIHSSYQLLIFGRILLGVSMICGVGLASLFLIEVGPLESRGSTGSLIQIFRGLGGTAGMIIALPEFLGTSQLWPLALAIPAGPAIVQFVVLLYCMESPRHLFITEGRTDKAAKAIEFYQGRARVAPGLDELRSEQRRIGLRKSADRSISFWRPLLLAILALTNRSLAGILPVQSYSTDMFMATGLSRYCAHAPHSLRTVHVLRYTAAHCTVLLGICHLVSATAVTFSVEQWGRKPLLVGANIGCLLSLLLVASFSSHSSVLARPFAVLSLALFMLIYPVVASVSNIVASEICHQRIRSSAFTVGLLVYSLVGLSSTFAYPLLKRSIGLALSFAPFCIFLLLTIVVYIVWLPETGGKTFESVAFDRNVNRKEMVEPLLLKETNDFINQHLEEDEKEEEEEEEEKKDEM